MLQTVWFIIRGFARIVLVFFKRYHKILKKTKEISCDKADSLKHILLYLKITMAATKFTDVSKGHVSKDLYPSKNCATILAHYCNNFGCF